MPLKLSNGRVVFQYAPINEGQKRFHGDGYKVPFRLISAGTGAGKTICGCYEDLRWALENEGIVGVIFEPSFPMVRRILLPTLETDWLLGKPIESNPFVRRFNRAEMKLELHNPEWPNPESVSTLYFVSLEEPERAEGMNVDFVHDDEARLVRNFELAWQVQLRRLRGSNSAIPFPTGAWVTTTPDAPDVSEEAHRHPFKLFNYFENPKTKSAQSHVYRWSIYDNPKLSEDFIKEIERTHHGGLADRFIYGRFAAVGGGSFPFDSSIHVVVSDPSRLTNIRYGIDFGWTNPTAALATGYDSDGCLYVFDEIYKSQMRTEELIAELQGWYATYGRGEMVCDATSPETIDRLCRAGLKAVANKAKREDGIRELGSRFLKAGDGKPRVFVSAKCVNLISELMEYNIDVKERDHAVDALRYSLILKSLAPLDAFKFGR